MEEGDRVLQSSLPERRRRQIRVAKERTERKRKLPPHSFSQSRAPAYNLTCGRCGARGHIKTNKMCPMSRPAVQLPGRLKVISREQQQKQQQEQLAKALPQQAPVPSQGSQAVGEGKAGEARKQLQRNSTCTGRAEKRPLPQNSQSGPPRKRSPVRVDPLESFSCMRRPCRPARPCPPPRRCPQSPQPFPSAQLPSERPASPPVKLATEPLQKKRPPLPAETSGRRWTWAVPPKAGLFAPHRLPPSRPAGMAEPAGPVATQRALPASAVSRPAAPSQPRPLSPTACPPAQLQPGLLGQLLPSAPQESADSRSPRQAEGLRGAQPQPRGQVQWLAPPGCFPVIATGRKLPISGPEISRPISKEQRPERQAMKMQAQREREHAAQYTGLGRSHFFLQRQHDLEVANHYGYMI